MVYIYGNGNDCNGKFYGSGIMWYIDPPVITIFIGGL